MSMNKEQIVEHICKVLSEDSELDEYLNNQAEKALEDPNREPMTNQEVDLYWHWRTCVYNHILALVSAAQTNVTDA